MAERDGEGFISRWSRRKQETSEAPAHVSDDETTPALDYEAAEDDFKRPLTPEEVEALPDVESLQADSDFTVYLREGVPDALRRRALRRLWRLNPVFAHLDGLNEYDEDFNDIKLVGDAVQTIYKAGRGYFATEDKKTPVRPSEENPLPAWEVAEGEEGEADKGDDHVAGSDGETDEAVATEAKPDAAETTSAEPDGAEGLERAGDEMAIVALSPEVESGATVVVAADDVPSEPAGRDPDQASRRAALRPGGALRRRWGGFQT